MSWYEELLRHWPFVAAVLIFATMGTVMKASVWTKARAARSRVAWYMRATLPLHPVLAGLLFGLVPGVPLSPGIANTTAASALYYAGAGALSVYIFDLTKRWREHRGISLPTRPSLPPEPDP